MIKASKFVSRLVISPSELPAAELPEYEPSPAELQALEDGLDVDELLGSMLTLAAYEQCWRELMATRAELRARGLLDLDAYDAPTLAELGRAA